jgi:phage baseplate assembly protein gpV
MGESLFKRLNRHQKSTAQDANWFTCVPAIVADNADPEHQHRIRVTIPAIDEDQIHDEWIRQLGNHAGSGGYGSFYIPKIGQEVMLFSEFGQGENLFYMSVYNEDNDVPGDFPDESVKGMRSDGDLKFITDGGVYIRGGDITLECDFGAMKFISPAGEFHMTKREEE